MIYLDKNGLQAVTNKLVQGDAIKVASHKGHTVKNVIDNITRECENVATPNTMTLENRVSEFKVGKGRDVDVSGNVEEGKIEVELQGKTWQNVVHGKKSVQNNIFTIEDGKYIFNNNATSSGGIIFSLICKPNTTYTLIINFLECALGDNTIYIDGHPVYLSTIHKNLPKTKGTHAISFVTKDDVTDKKMKLAILSSSTSKLVIDENIIVLEGDYTQTPIEELPKYFEGIKSSFENEVVEVEVRGKNLFDGSYRFGYLQGGDTHLYIDRDSGATRSAILKVKPNTTYNISKEYSIRNTIGLFKDYPINNTPYTPIPLNINGTRVNTGDNNYMVVYVSNESEEPWLQVEEGFVATPYEPYYKKKISFNIGEPLRSLPNGVCDEIRNNKGQWELVRRVHKVVLDGSEIWTRYERWDTTNTIQFYLDYSTGLPNTLLEYSAGYCDRFAYKSYPEFNNKQDREGFIIYGGYKNDTNILKTFSPQISISKSKLSTLDVNGFKQWLSQNPTTFYYQLETPTITPIEPMEFDVKPLATMTISSEIAPISNHKVVLNRAGQIEQGIVQISELKKRVDSLETAYDSYLLETQHKLSLLGFEYQLESEEI